MTEQLTMSGIASRPRFYADVNDIVRHVTDAGSHFFSPKAMKFFNSRLTTDVFGYYGNVFITSEKCDMSFSEPEPRRYTVRAVDPFSGLLSDASKFQEFATPYEARKFAKAYAAKQDIEWKVSQ